MKNILGVCCLLLALSQTVKGDHLLGGEIYYQHVSGSGANETYRVTIALYGDCGVSSSSLAYALLPAARPVVYVFNNNVYFATLNLQRTGNGVEVTPACPAQAGQTKCTNTSFPLPGIIRYTYTATVTLPDTGANWRFSFEGDLGGLSNAGRSNIIGNANVGGGALMCLEATLNNTTGPNNAAICTAVPVPFFCINQPQQYNPTGVDTDNDSLVFGLVPAKASPAVNLTYIGGYTAQNPLPVSGTLNFQPTTGQMSFTPNLVQNSIVVNRVDEYRNGIRVGSSMREMTFFILANCNNQAPVTGSVSGLTIGNATGSNEITVCTGANDTLSFQVTCTDPDGDNIQVTFTGLPPGASASVQNNGTPNPQLFFEWDLAGVTPGTYIFYVTLTDDGCPLVSTQTIAYTVIIGGTGSFTVHANTPLCTGETLQLGVNAPAGGTYEWTGPNGFFSTAANPSIPGATPVHSGIYSVRVEQNGCPPAESSVTVHVYDQPIAEITADVRKGCGPDTVYFASTGTPALDYVWDLGDGNVRTDSSFTYVYTAGGTYTVTLYTSNSSCADTVATSVTVEGSRPLEVIVSDIQPVRCNGGYEGGFSVEGAGGEPPYRYGLNGQLPVSNGNFTGLAAGRYVVSVTDDKGCMGTDTVILSDPPLLSLFVTEVKDDLCEESRTPNGSAGLWIDGGTPPYRLLLNGESQDEHTSLKGLSEGVHTVVVQDVNGCSRASSFSLSHAKCCTLHLPSAFTPNGDGRNDHARPVTTGGVVLVEFRIYNRWGEPVYEATPGGGRISGWDGLYKGVPAEIGTYHYTLQYACPGDNRNRHEKGDITLIR